MASIMVSDISLHKTTYGTGYNTYFTRFDPGNDKDNFPIKDYNSISPASAGRVLRVIGLAVSWGNIPTLEENCLSISLPIP